MIEIVEKLDTLEKKTKGGFGKVKDDFKKLNESLDQRFAEVMPSTKPEEIEALKNDLQTAQQAIQAKIIEIETNMEALKAS